MDISDKVRKHRLVTGDKKELVNAIFERVKGRRGRGRPRLTWKQVIRVDILACGIGETVVKDRRVQKAAIRRLGLATGGIRV